MIKKCLLSMSLLLFACTHSLKTENRQPSSESNQNNLVQFYDFEKCKIESSSDNCEKRQFNFSDENDIRNFISNLNLYKELSKNSESQHPKDSIPLEMKEQIKFRLNNKGLKNGIKFIQERIQQGTVPTAKEIQEIYSAIENNFRTPLDTDFQLIAIPYTVFKWSYYNQVDLNSKNDTSYTQYPFDSNSYLQNNYSVSMDLYSAFNRVEIPKLSGQLCSYEKSKSGYGVHSGFHVQCDKESYKLKFGNEIYSGPFNTRIYSSMGYTVPHIDFVEVPLVKYDRRILTEFNNRINEEFHLKLGDKNIVTINSNIYKSPFLFIKNARLNNGQVISVDELKTSLFSNYADKSELVDSNYKLDFENKIDSLEFVSATYTLKTDDEEIGAWRFDQHNHSDRREVKALQILAAWVGNFDMRMDNNRLIYKKKGPDKFKLIHALSDVGSGLGKSDFLLTKSSSEINDMPWVVTETYKDGDDSPVSPDRLQIVGLMNIEVNQAFKKMTYQDGQWMIMKLCQLTDDQIKAALIGAGLNSAEARLAYEKLLNRRNKMIDDFSHFRHLTGFENEPLILKCKRSVDQSLNFKGDFSAKLPNGSLVHARPSLKMSVKNGVLISEP